MKGKRYRQFMLGMAGVLFAASLSGCGNTDSSVNSKKNKDSVVQISVWTDVETEAILKEELEAFKELHKDEANLEFSVSVEAAGSCKDTVLANPKGAADIFTFADDQFGDLYKSGVLLEVTKNTDEVIREAGGEESGAVQSASRDGKLYAYPETNSNGYFLYYNKRYFSDEDIKSLDRIMEVCARNHKKFAMDFSSGWYIYSFFKGAGLKLEYDEKVDANICNWNAEDTEIKGIDVVEAMLEIADNEAFMTLDDVPMVSAIQSGVVIAGVNGAWNSEKIGTAWGENFAAAKLPTYTVCGQQKQMCSFLGYKLMAVNANTKYPEWCMEVAQYLTGEENILKRCEITKECPANVRASQSDLIQQSPVVKALADQTPYGYRQSVADSFWMASSRLGIIIASGNLENQDLQKLLDETQAEICTTVKPGEGE